MFMNFRSTVAEILSIEIRSTLLPKFKKGHQSPPSDGNLSKVKGHGKTQGVSPRVLNIVIDIETLPGPSVRFLTVIVTDGGQDCHFYSFLGSVSQVFARFCD